MITLTWLLRLPLPAVKESSSQLNQQLFLLLKDYSKAGAASGENYQLVQSCFRVLVHSGPRETHEAPTLRIFDHVSDIDGCLTLSPHPVHHGAGEECEDQ